MHCCSLQLTGKRHVVPYTATIHSYAKKRWLGRRILDVFLSEFRANPEEYTVRGQLCLGGLLCSM